MKRYRIINRLYKTLLFLLLTVIPLTMYHLDGGMSSWYPIYYHLICGATISLAYDLPLFLKRKITGL